MAAVETGAGLEVAAITVAATAAEIEVVGTTTEMAITVATAVEAVRSYSLISIEPTN